MIDASLGKEWRFRYGCFVRMEHGTYDKLEAGGLVAPGIGINGEDIIIGKTAPLPPDSEELGQRTRAHARRDVSIHLRSTENGIVDQVLISTNESSVNCVRMGVPAVRSIPEPPSVQR
ncbi:hypothetical protein CALVIDRAFT_590609 [Calocera viscosa TUFC12733]|uniref:DNA-directed RNA polymerase subunit 2 hybrid-binding domain-containing protein n=1 Tax=Calocera viscosa (strain TUFC12733) TaxID=1330018 RepID=A0A167GKS5_CALVF|nr:hypothetical protein CALVIDRAFT_590609 [Calocera viscosa TUFC12733]